MSDSRLDAPPTAGGTTRRRVVQAGLLGLAGLGAGCATSASPAAARVVVVGGGWAGLGAVRALADGGRVEITLVEPNAGFMSCPLSAHFITGHLPAAYFQRSYDNVDKLVARRVRERVTGIDRAARTVATATQSIPYDFLILAPGIEYMEDAIAGFAEARAQLPVGFRAFEQAAVKAEVDRFLVEGGEFVISVPKPPYRCPPAPYERAFLIAEQIKRRGTKGKVVLLDANPAPLPSAMAGPIEAAIKSLYAGQIQYLPQTEVQAVNIGRRRLATTFGEVPFTAANVIPPMRASGLVRQAGLGERWAAVRLPGFESQADDRVWVIGDAQGSPLPKSGQVAFTMGQQVARQVLRRAAGEAPLPATGVAELPTGICWSSTSAQEAIRIGVTGSLQAGQPPKLQFQVDPAPTAAAGRAAMVWGEGLWQAMLG